MATLEELQAELQTVNKAVAAAYGGQEMDIQDGDTRRRWRRQDLSVLLRRKAELEASIGRLDGTRGPGFAMPVDSRSCYNR